MSLASGKLSIAVDAMGGDYAPDEVIAGSIAALREQDIEIVLVGPPEILREKLAEYDIAGLPLSCVDASEYIREGEPPATVLRQKRDASILVATKLAKTGQVDAVVSAGPTGAVVAAGLMVLGTIEGVERPVFGGSPIGLTEKSILLDCGGNIDCKPEHLLNFALVGSVYVRKLKGVENPTIALLSVGSEEGKGNELVKESYHIFQESGMNFIGNVEGNDIVTGKANVIVCDGFIGNVLLKFCEGLGYSLNHWLRSRLNGKMADNDRDEICNELRAITNAADIIGGVPLLGINGNVVVMHGRSRATQFLGALSCAGDLVRSGFVEGLNSELIRIRRQ
jgi:glycerol-3-phosphate acyltransferase PlsX